MSGKRMRMFTAVENGDSAALLKMLSSCDRFRTDMERAHFVRFPAFSAVLGKIRRLIMPVLISGARDETNQTSLMLVAKQRNSDPGVVN